MLRRRQNAGRALPPAGRRRARRPFGGSGRRHRGQSVVEFALLVPILLFMLLIAVDFGRLFFSYIQLQNGVREAAASGAGAPTRNDVMLARATQERNSQGQAGEGAFTLTTECRNQTNAVIACSASPGGTGRGNTITVTLQSPFSFITPLINGFFGGSGLTMTASTTTAVLGSAASGGGPGSSIEPCDDPPSLATFVVTSVDLTVTADPNGSLPDTPPCAIAGYNWDFGWTNTDADTAVGSSLPATHTYPNPGTYTITLQVTNQAGSLTATRVVTVPAPVPTPTPSPSPSPSTSASPDPSGSASPSPSPSTSPSASPSPSPSPTPFVCTAPVADFTWTAGNPKRNVTFTDRSTYVTGCPITGWLWNFGDGSPSSNAVNPAHEFPSNNGSWTVTLTVTNSAGSSTRTTMVSPQ